LLCTHVRSAAAPQRRSAAAPQRDSAACAAWHARRGMRGVACAAWHARRGVRGTAPVGPDAAAWRGAEQSNLQDHPPAGLLTGEKILNVNLWDELTLEQ